MLADYVINHKTTAINRLFYSNATSNDVTQLNVAIINTPPFFQLDVAVTTSQMSVTASAR